MDLRVHAGPEGTSPLHEDPFDRTRPVALSPPGRSDEVEVSEAEPPGVDSGVPNG
jgi:hypothetical protein